MEPVVVLQEGCLRQRKPREASKRCRRRRRWPYHKTCIPPNVESQREPWRLPPPQRRRQQQPPFRRKASRFGGSITGESEDGFLLAGLQRWLDLDEEPLPLHLSPVLEAVVNVAVAGLLPPPDQAVCLSGLPPLAAPNEGAETARGGDYRLPALRGHSFLPPCRIKSKSLKPWVWINIFPRTLQPQLERFLPRYSPGSATLHCGALSTTACFSQPEESDTPASCPTRPGPPPGKRRIRRGVPPSEMF